MDESQQTLLGELCQKFIILNVTLYEYKYGETSEGRRRLKLYNSLKFCIRFAYVLHTFSVCKRSEMDHIINLLTNEYQSC